MANSMLKVVFDTNLIVSATLNADGLPALLLSLALEKKIKLFVSNSIIKEYQQVLNRPRFGFEKKSITVLIKSIKQAGKLIEPKIKLDIIKNDEPDNRILECALKAKADFIVTGNKKHFNFEKFKNIKIVTPREFINQSGIDWI